MKTRQIQDLKNLSLPELRKNLKESQEKLRSLRFDLAAGKVKNIAEIRNLRKTIARMLTFIKISGSSRN